jgi:membrane protease YdiL (CAAX protease family)
MLSPKPWRPEAIVRLAVCVFVCIYGGSLASSAIYYYHPHGTPNWKVALPMAAAFMCMAVTLFVLRKPWDLENFRKRMVALLVSFYLGLILGFLAHKAGGSLPKEISTAQLIVGTLSFQGAAVLLVARFVREHHVTWQEAFGLSNHRHQAILVGVIAACLFLPLGWLLQQLSVYVMTQLHFSPEEQQPVQTLRQASFWGDRVVLGLVTIVLAPTGEELLFRGLLYPWIKQAGYPRLALWTSALLFAAMHMNLPIFLPLVVLAIVLAIIYDRTNNLLAPLVAHALFNALNFAALYLMTRNG